MTSKITPRRWILWLILFLSACVEPSNPLSFKILPADLYFDKVYGAWQATMVANHTGLLHEGKYLKNPAEADAIELALLEQWSTDDDTSIEWVDLHILETHGLDPTYQQIRDEWVDHLKE